MKMKKVYLLVLMTIPFLFINCADDKTEPSNGVLTIKMTDAPFPLELVAEAKITISRIEVRKKDSLSNESPYQILSEVEKQYDLVKLVNGLTETLVEVDIPAGSYDLVRLYVKEAVVKLTDGRAFDLKVPSGSQSGIKVFVKPAIEVAGGLSSDLLLDFNLSKSFVPTGNINAASGITGFNFKPVIKAVNISTSGTLMGVVNDTISNPIKGAEISIYAADTLNTSTFTDTLGNYTVLGLLEGAYKVKAEATGFITEEAMTEIVKGNNTTLDFSLVPQEQ